MFFPNAPARREKDEAPMHPTLPLPPAPAPDRPPLGNRSRRGLQALLVAALGLVGLACGFADTAGNLARYNAYWNCPTVSPVPTICGQVTGTPDPLGTPGPPEPQCSAPRETATPYGRQILSQGHQTSLNIFHHNQDVRWGTFRLNYTGKTAGAVLTTGLQVWIFTFDSSNEGADPLDIAWPDRLVVREVQRADGSTLQQTWRTQTTEAYRASGLPIWRDSAGHYEPGQQRTIQVPILTAVGTPVAIGFSLDPGVTGGPTPQAGDRREGLDNEAQLAWFLDVDDPYCDGNPSGPTRLGDGGAVYPQAQPPTPVGSFSQFAGWPMAGADHRITQNFGCTDFPELRGYPCPPGAPYFHTGIDFGNERGTLLRSVVYGTVIFVGDSRNPNSRSCDCASYPGACPWTHSDAPHYNLGWAIYIQADDGIYTVKYGHTIVGSEAALGISVGTHVEPGQPIAQEGSTGCSSGPHLHLMFVDRTTGAFIDPMNFLGPNRAQRTQGP